MIGLKKKIIYSLIILCLIIIGLFIFAKIATAEKPAEPIIPDKLLISQIQITGGPGLTTNDFVKIYNPHDFAVDLKGYRLVKRTKTGTSDTSLKSWTIETIIPAQGYHLWANSQDGFADSLSANSSTTQTIANNNGLAIRFGSNNKGEIIDSLGWGEYNNEFVETTAFPTNPEANQILSRTNNLDTDNNANDFSLPQAENEEPEEIEEIIEENIDPEPAPAGSSSSPEPAPSGSSSSSSSALIISTPQEPEKELEPAKPRPKPVKIYISEILPNPLGIDGPDCFDCGEFIELYNAGEEIVNLYQWQIKADDRTGFVINHYLPIYPDQRIVFYKYQTNLVLKNNKGEIKLYQPDNTKVKQLIKYKTANEGASYNLMPDLKTWQWSKLISPQENNTINYQPEIEFSMPATAKTNEEIIFDASDTYDQDDAELSFSWDFGDGQKSTDKNPLHSFAQPGKYTVELIVSDKINKVIKKQNIEITGIIAEAIIAQESMPAIIMPTPAVNNNGLSVSGVVIVLPGILGSQFFYILPRQEQGSLERTAIQIYSYNKTFPVLALGDYIQVQGELSDMQTETRIKIKQANDIQILEHDYIVIEREIKADQINKQLVNQLISIMGKVIGKDGANIIIYDGSAEAIIYLSPGANINKALAVDNSYRVIGLARQTKSGIKIMPRSIDDIMLIDEDNKNIILKPEVLGEKIGQNNQNKNKSKTIIIPPRNQKEKLLGYALMILTAIIIGLLVYIIKLHKNKLS